MSFARRISVAVMMAFCLNLAVLPEVFAVGEFDISDEASMDAALDQAVDSVDQNPESVRQREEVAAEEAAKTEAAEDDATRGSLLPKTTEDYKTIEQCKKLMNYIAGGDFDKEAIFQDNGSLNAGPGLTSFTQSDVLGCGIKTGNIRLWMVPYYVRYILEFMIQMAGLIAVGGIVYGGYLYLFAGVSDEKDKGKKSIMYSVAGMLMTMIAWAVVNIVLGFLTG